MTEQVEDFPRDEEHRFVLYRLCDCPECEGRGKIDAEIDEAGNWYPIKPRRCFLCRGEGRIRDKIAAAEDPEGLGLALVTLANEGELEGCAIGILDVLATGEPGDPKWKLKPWLPSPRNRSDAGRVLASGRKANDA